MPLAVPAVGTYNPEVADTTQLWAGSPLAFVPGVEALDGPGRNRPSVDFTAISDSVQVLRSGKGKLDDCTFNLRYDSNEAAHVMLEQANKNNSTIAAEVRLSDGGVISFTATVPIWKHNESQDSPLAVSCALRPTRDFTVA